MLLLLLLLMLLLISNLALHVLVGTSINRSSVRDPPRHGHHVSLFDSISSFLRRNLRWKHSGHAMLLISLRRLFRRVDVGSLSLMLESLSCYKLTILSCCNGD